jgi:hypothetical protein
MNPKRVAAGVAVLAAGGFLAGTVGEAAAQAPPDPSVAARNAALNAVGGGTVLEVERERTAAGLVYEVEVRRMDGAVVEVLVDANGTVVSTAGDDGDGPGDADGPFDDD